MKCLVFSSDYIESIGKDYLKYPTGQPFYGLNPIKLKSGEYSLPADVLDDPVFKEVFPLLSTFEQREVADEEFEIEEQV